MTPQARILGSTGFNASMLGIGDLADRAVPMARCVATMHRAMDFGLILIDTAPGYEDGYREAIVGTALRGRGGAVTLAHLRQLEPSVAGENLRNIGLLEGQCRSNVSG